MFIYPFYSIHSIQSNPIWSSLVLSIPSQLEWWVVKPMCLTTQSTGAIHGGGEEFHCRKLNVCHSRSKHLLDQIEDSCRCSFRFKCCCNSPHFQPRLPLKIPGLHHSAGTSFCRAKYCFDIWLSRGLQSSTSSAVRRLAFLVRTKAFRLEQLRVLRGTGAGSWSWRLDEKTLSKDSHWSRKTTKRRLRDLEFLNFRFGDIGHWGYHAYHDVLFLWCSCMVRGGTILQSLSEDRADLPEGEAREAGRARSFQMQQREDDWFHSRLCWSAERWLTHMAWVS